MTYSLLIALLSRAPALGYILPSPNYPTDPHTRTPALIRNARDLAENVHTPCILSVPPSLPSSLPRVLAYLPWVSGTSFGGRAWASTATLIPSSAQIRVSSGSAAARTCTLSCIGTSLTQHSWSLFWSPLSGPPVPFGYGFGIFLVLSLARSVVRTVRVLILFVQLRCAYVYSLCAVLCQFLVVFVYNSASHIRTRIHPSIPPARASSSTSSPSASSLSSSHLVSRAPARPLLLHTCIPPPPPTHIAIPHAPMIPRQETYPTHLYDLPPMSIDTILAHISYDSNAHITL